jgi:hypothetical protein
VIDLGQGWRTGRLDLEPLAVAHAAELSPTGDVHHGEVCWASSPAAAP